MTVCMARADDRAQMADDTLMLWAAAAVAVIVAGHAVRVAFGWAGVAVAGLAGGLIVGLAVARYQTGGESDA